MSGSGTKLKVLIATPGALMLPVIGFIAVWLRYRHMPKQILPKGWLTLALWMSAAVMAFMTTPCRRASPPGWTRVFFGRR